MKTNLTIQSVEQYYKSPEAKRAAVALVSAMIEADTVRKQVDELIAPMFAMEEFYSAFDGHRITDEDDLYMADLDSPEMKAWDAKREEAIQANFDIEPGKCPALVAENNVRKLENELLRIASEHFGVDFRADVSIRERALALFLAPFAGESLCA